MTQRILNADPSPDDPRDFPFEADMAVELPGRYLVSGLGPVLDQGASGTCVPHAASGLRQWQEKRDGHGVIDVDPFELYDLCKAVDLQPDPHRRLGTTLRTALRVLKGSGTPLKGGGRAGKIGAYWRVGASIAAVKRALLSHGLVLARLDWDANWMFLPSSRIVRAPAGQLVGGHAFDVIGWDDRINSGSLILRNSWGPWSKGGNGNAYLAFRHFLSHRPEAWATTDVND